MRTRVSTVAAPGLLVLALALLAACGSSPTVTGPQHPIFARDADGTAISIPAQPPRHIVSLSPTDSEILGALGVNSRVIGVDTYTDYPADLAAKPKVSDANGYPNVEQIVALKPDLVLGYGGETSKQDQQLLQAHLDVISLPNAPDLATVLKDIQLVGQLVHADAAANQVVASMQRRIDAVKAKVAGAPAVSVYMEAGYTPPPPYAYGGGSFGDELIATAGGTNVFHGDTANQGYPSVSAEAIIAANPQVIVLTEDPQYGGAPAKVPQRPGWSTIAAVQSGRIYTINPDLIQRPGPRLADGLEQLAKDLHPDRFP
jgi:iron complex transport system substrate-binding protein